MMIFSRMRRIRCFVPVALILVRYISEQHEVEAWVHSSWNTLGTGNGRPGSKYIILSKAHSEPATDVSTTQCDSQSTFDDFVDFLLHQQTSIIDEIERTIEGASGQKFGRDGWGMFASLAPSTTSSKSGGITRVIQNGAAIEKGACSLTVLRNGILSAERAASIQSRQDNSDAEIQAGDVYSAVALSMVLHSRNPMVPTFRSDVRMFQVVQSRTNETITWLGGGADLTPYYLYHSDIESFHHRYADLCRRHALDAPFTYAAMKKACDDYFYLPARQEHRGVGGIFFDDMAVTIKNAIPFAREMTQTWMPSWIPIVQVRNDLPYTESQKYWQKLLRGRYLEFNLLYDVRKIYLCHIA